MKKVYDFSHLPPAVVREASPRQKSPRQSNLAEYGIGNEPLPVEPMKISWIPDHVEVTKENLLAYLNVTEEERKHIWSIDQRDPLWHLHRAGRLTGSRAGAAAGHNPYSSPQQLVHEWLYVPVTDNAAMKYGRDNEGGARDMYMEIKRRQNTPKKVAIEFATPPSYLDEDFRHVELQPVDPNQVSEEPYDIRVDVRGLVIHPVKTYCGYSADGEVFETDDKGLLEIKCPRYKIYNEIPWMYYDQIQFGKDLYLASLDKAQPKCFPISCLFIRSHMFHRNVAARP